MKMKNSKLLFWAIIDSLGIFVYVSLVAFIMFNSQKLFGKIDNFTGPLVLLLLFIVSAVITGSLFLGRPAWLYFNGLKNEGVRLFFYTLASLIVITLIVFAIKII
ncbi:MAG: hypothetical protein NTX55_01660 [Candidatus Parcubacteria bacterium]|nr:hypothetical protein [Candidatus Parcubacteria bacterium]